MEEKKITYQDILQPIEEELKKVEHLILENLETDIPLLTEVGQYILQTGGKRVRPAMMLFAAGALGNITDQVYQAANVIEYIHTATLLHDDVVDNAELRRSNKSARSIWGNEAAVLVGDYLYTVSFKYIASFNNHEVVQSLANATTLMARGEILQLIRTNDSATEDEYMEIIFHKTASLMATTMEIGGILAGATADQRRTLYECGKRIGIAFQLVDDALDYDLDNKGLGKKQGTDLKERKITLPLSHLLENASADDKEYILDILDKDEISDADVNNVGKMMFKYRSGEFTIAQAKSNAEEAKKILRDGIPDNAYRRSIESLADFIVYRKK